jgi:hypothetical protein
VGQIGVENRRQVVGGEDRRGTDGVASGHWSRHILSLLTENRPPQRSWVVS